MTVDTAHALVTDDTSREVLYVAATRGRHSTRLYQTIRVARVGNPVPDAAQASLSTLTGGAP